MKNRILFFLFTCLMSFGLSAQKVNPATQIKQVGATSGQVLQWTGTGWNPATVVNTVSNGLTKTGSSVVLGGALTGTTSITGADLYELNISAINQFSLTKGINTVIFKPAQFFTQIATASDKISQIDMAGAQVNLVVSHFGFPLRKFRIDSAGYTMDNLLYKNSGSIMLWDSATQRMTQLPASYFKTVSTGATLTGSGTPASPLGLAQQSASSGQVLQWNGSAWVPGTVTASLSTYSAGSGCIVTATGPGITFVRTTTSEWVINIPTAVELLSFEIYSTSGQNPGASAYLNFNYSGTRPYNNNTDGSDANPPILKGVNLSANGTAITRSNEQPYDLTTGATNLIFKLSAVGSADLEVKVENYTTVLGSGASLLKGHL